MFISFLAVQIAQFGSGLQPPVDNEYSPAAAATSGESALNAMSTMVSNVISIGTVMAGIFFIVYFLLAAYAWITSEGDSGKLEKARKQMIHAVIGLVIVVAAYAVVGLVGSLVGIDILRPAESLNQLVPKP